VSTDNATDTRTDGALVNVITGLGVPSKDKTAATGIASRVLLSERELEALYVSGVPRRYVDAIADEILRHRTTLKLGNDNLSEERSQQLINDFEAFLQTTNFHHALSEVVKLQRLYGGAGLVLLIDDGQEPDQPVDPARIRAVQGFVPLSRHELIPEDVTLTDWSKPAHYRISTNQRLTEGQTEITTNLIVHHTRVARFDGLYLPWNLRSQNTGWGMSVLQLVWDAFKRYESTLGGLENMTSDADLFVHKIPGLFQRLAAGGEADIRKRLEANALSRSMYGGMVVDKEEEVVFLNRALANLANATDPFIQDLQAATGWPASILMGTSPGGLGKEGRFEERVWASLVEQWQEVYCRNSVTEIFTYIFASQEGPTKGRIPPSWSVQFPSVFTQTDEEKLQVRKQAQDIDVQYISNGVLTAMEVRVARFGGQEYSFETTLDEEATERFKVKEDMQFEAELVGMQRSMQPPDTGIPPEDGATPPPGDPSQTGMVEEPPLEPELEQ
jgi:phage-related protein (TIGR01555 family)